MLARRFAAVVVVPLAVAALLTRALSPISSRLVRAGWHPALAATLTLLGFLVAFVPIVVAVAAGVVAVLVALVTAGTVPALIVAAVARVVQQLDNELLAPLIHGRAVQLHALVGLLGIAAGGSLFGLVGTFFAVPVLAVGRNALDEVRHDRARRGPAPA